MKQLRIIALIICAVLVCGFFAACTPKTPENPDTGSDGTPSDGQNEANDPFLCPGEDFYMVAAIFPKNIRDYTEDELEKLEEEDETHTLSPESQAMADRVLAMEAKYGIKIIDAGLTSWYLTSADFGAGLAAGEVHADITHSEVGWARDAFISGFLAPASEYSKYIDPSDNQKWGGEDILMAGTYKGQLWGFAWHGSAYSPCPYINYGQMLCKDSVYESFNLDNTPQELVEGGDWTFDGFVELLPSVSNTDYRNQVFGLCYSTGLSMMAVYANGGDKVVFDEASQKYVFGLTRPEAIHAIEWSRELASMVDYATELSTNAAFLDNMCTFFITNGNRIIDIFKETDEFTYMPFPYGPDAEYGKTCSTYIKGNDSICAIVKNANADKQLCSARIFNELTEPLDSGSFADGYPAYYYRNTFAEGAEFSFKIYQENGLNVHWSYELDLGSTLDNNITLALYKIANGTDSPETVMGALVDEVNSQLDLVLN